jgi:phosphohistidine phosphatase
MRRLLLVRHAIACQRDATRWPDDVERPLTAAGKKRFARTARGLRGLIETPDVLFTSPLKRARQTARILTREAGFPRAAKMSELRPGGGTAKVIAALRTARKKDVAIVGHEPDLSMLASELLIGSTRLQGRLKKGGVVLLELKEFGAGKARLHAFAPPRLFTRDKR